MYLKKLEIRNYRLLINADLNVDKDTTLIVGRNNTAKTSCMDFLYKILKVEGISYDDYPLCYRKYAFSLLLLFLKNKISFEKFLDKLPKPSIKFFIDYMQEDDEEFLGALSPFIIEVDDTITEVNILAEYELKCTEQELRGMFEGLITFEDKKPVFEEVVLRDIVAKNFHKKMTLTVKAINPANKSDIQNKSLAELKELFPIYAISAERDLDETGNNRDSSLKTVISNYFKVDINDVDTNIADKVTQLRDAVKGANASMQNITDGLLSEMVNKTVDFGYPNAEELELGVLSNVSLESVIQGSSELTYKQKNSEDRLPSNYNGLGYKNLIKIQFQLAEFADYIKQEKISCIPLLFIEEPEAHMHPQMQQTFISYLESFIKKLSHKHIQIFITSHSAHIANTIDFSKIRYAQKNLKGVIYKDLNAFAVEDTKNISFIKKFLTISKCDLFFADKAILIEGAAERILLPDIINKCKTNGFKLKSQYYTLVEVGGAYAFKFIKFLEFLGIPGLIITDIDPIKEGKKSLVQDGETTSNATIQYWIRKTKGLEADAKIEFSDITSLGKDKKTLGRIHIEYQTSENGLCGRSLEEAIKNVNRDYYKLKESPSEKDLEFDGKSKTEFALDLIINDADYVV
ncbi:MAG: AAA family ATPase, partial [Ruminococcus sp.]|nr:AAA family ATPase [Ruminococcus sp.]